MMRRSALLFALFFLLNSFVVAQAAKPAKGAKLAQAAAAPAIGLEGLDDFAARTMKDWKVPGVAVVVIKDGKVILSRGYGVRDMKNNLPVTSKTLFAIGSATKSFTVATLGTLARQGKVDWDTPVREYLPNFRLWNETLTDHMTPRDLVTHRSGLPRHDAMWYNSDATRDELFARLRYLEPSKDLRATFQYNNLMFFTAGYLAGKLNGTSWEEAVRNGILTPLGMNATDFSVADMQKSPDYALPYEQDDKEKVQLIPFRTIDQMGPAGSINSNVEDLAQYVLMHLNQGKHGDVQVINAADVQQMQTPQMVIPGPLLFPEVGHTSYGMGLFITTYRGHKLVQHGGNIDGFSALVSFMPQDNLGVVVLTNLSVTPYPSVLAYNLYDRLLGLSQVDWNGRLLERVKKAKAAEEEAKTKGYTPQVPNTKPSHDLAQYVGDYQNPGYGVVKIERDGDALKITYNHFTSPLKHFHYDVFQVPANELDRLERTKVMFQTDWNGEIASLAIPFEPEVHDIVFQRVGESSMRSKAFLETLAGTYELGPTKIVFSLQGEDTLVLSVPGQPLYELEPVKGTVFNVKGQSGFRLEFKKDASGKVTECVFYQPNGTFVAKKQ